VQKIDDSEDVIIVRDNHSYAMFLPPDMLSVKRFRREIDTSLRDHQFSSEDVEQIKLACDEALTNSITANLKNESLETIICRWKIEHSTFYLLIMDYGKGVPKEKIVNIDVPNSLLDIIEKFKKNDLENPNFLPFNGICKKHKNMGQGLNIIKKIMDKVSIHYHRMDGILESFSDSVDGSILEMEFSSKKK
jgi:anti-sigma regulatory factor (Ser/Thr protein kinase)